MKVKGEDNEAEAVRAWHKLLSEEPKPSEQPKLLPKAVATVRSVLDAFLADLQGRVKANTFRNYKGLLDAFSSGHGDMKAEGFTVATATTFVNRPAWSSSYRHNLLGAIATAFKWAEGIGLIDVNPLKKLKRPPKASRGSKAVVTEDVHLKLKAVATPALRLLLDLLRETGARPSELSRLTSQDVDFDTGVVILTDHKTAGSTGKPRLIFLTPKAVAILQAQAVRYPTGVLLRNAKGLPWKKDGIGLAMRRASKSAGVKGIAYGYRHGYATSALAKGIPDATVAALLGHSSTTMLHRHYSHLTSQAGVLREAALKARG